MGEGMSLQQMAPYCHSDVPKTRAEFVNHCEMQNDFSEKCCRQIPVGVHDVVVFRSILVTVI